MRVLFGTDGSAGAAQALDYLLRLPLSGAHEVIVASAVPRADAAEHSDRAVTAALARLGSRTVRASAVVREGPPVAVLSELAVELEADLVAVGSRGFGVVRGALFGSTARSLARISPVPLLVVRGTGARTGRIVLAAGGDARDARDLLEALGLVRDDTVLRSAATAREALELGEQADLIAVDSRLDPFGRGYFNDSVADQVLAQARCPVLVARAPLVTARPASGRARA